MSGVGKEVASPTATRRHLRPVSLKPVSSARQLRSEPPRNQLRSTRRRTRLFQRVRARESVDRRKRVSDPGRRISDSGRTSRQVREGPILLKKSEYRLGSIFSAPWARFSDADAGGASSSASNSTERVLNRSAAVVSVNRRCRLCFGRFATTLDVRLFQQYRPIADIGAAKVR